MLKRLACWGLLAITLLACRTGGLGLTIRFDQIDGLQKEAPVMFENQTIGLVTKVSPSGSAGQLVEVMIQKDFRAKATEHSRFYIAPDPADPNRTVVAMVQVRPGGTPLKDQAVIEGSSRPAVFFDQMLGGMTQGIEDLKKGFEEFSREMGKLTEGEAYQKLEAELKALASELKRSGQAAREEIQREWLPRLQAEMEKLRRRLKELGREHEMKPLEIEFERIKNS